ncbi:hypothetical protein [Chitinibacter tainanensis]|uniref:hypothetical protein n=1 Tax=Chitinibacter tainanensis TaxID=230667 RepID=UPI0004189757|nr:hypothetical protein [Chitinibacter tainanensis]
MINTTKGEIVFIQTDMELHLSIVAALKDASKWLLEAYSLQHLELNTVTTKNHHSVAFSAFVEQYILRNVTDKFDHLYVNDVYAFISIEKGNCPPSLYAAVTLIEDTTQYRKAHLPALRRGFLTFLVALHIRRAIVLPYLFKWPIKLEKSKTHKILGRCEICPLERLPELLRLLRSVNPREGAQQTDKVFFAYTPKQRERFVWMVQRLIICGGWLELADVNYQDMLALKVANDKTQFSGYPTLSLLMMADMLERKYGENSPVNAAGWLATLSNSKLCRAFVRTLETRHTNLLEHALSQSPATFAPEVLAKIEILPGLELDLQNYAGNWVTIERAFLIRGRLEKKKNRIHALGFFNIYLFGYLAYWYADNPDFAFNFPSTPEKLVSGVFVSYLGLLENQKRPLSLVEFLEKLAQTRNWEASSHYANLKQIEILFEFIEQHCNSLPGSNNFRQPLSKYDYPAQKKSTGTNKRPIPRRIFCLFLSYIETLVAFSSVILERLVSGEICDKALIGFDSSRTIIDCISLQNTLGYVPVLFHKGKTYPLRWIPNVFYAQAKVLKGVGTIKVPHPHALHQILVSLYTGLRQQHVQWLDADTFDRRIDAQDSREFAELYVNTDKTKSAAWTPFVNFRVIEVLRLQKTWRSLIDETGFNQRVYYDNNPETKWGTILPLFSYYSDGRPHSDAIYSSCWFRLLGGLQALLGQTGERELSLIRLLPTGVGYADLNIAEQLKAYGSKQQQICEVAIKSNITPHSARSSVISHTIGLLPADLIGRYLTGQTEATVPHYVVPDEEETFAEQVRQNLVLKQKGYENGYEEMLKASPRRKGAYIKADEVNSNLSRSLKSNIEETLPAYGCISLGFGEANKTGLDILRETRAAGAVENKTEICPYGNHCPSDVVSQLKGWRRCGPCVYAVRSIDHLPAITAKARQVLEGLAEIESWIATAENDENYSADELDALEQTRDILAEDFVAWQLAVEVLETMRQRIASGASNKSWHIQKPEIIEKNLRQTAFPNNATEYILARLQESEAFPMLESPQIRAKFDLMRRHILANTGNIRAAFNLETCTNPAAELLGLIRSIVAANKMTLEDLKEMLESDSFLESMPPRLFKLIPPDSK